MRWCYVCTVVVAYKQCSVEGSDVYRDEEDFVVETSTPLLFEKAAMNAVEVVRCTLELFGKKNWYEMSCGTLR